MRLLALSCAVLLFAASAIAFDHSHAAFDGVLKSHVRGEAVDYAALKKDRSALDRYLVTCAAVSEDQFKKWTKPQQLAFLINLYNAETLQLIIDHYPVKSIRKIGGWFSGPWEQPCVTLFGGATTLDYVEHGLLRPNYSEPRIHFALVCAAKGCPPLRREAYIADRLDAQLEEQGRVFLRTPQKNRVDVSRRTVYLSPIFKWFRADFERNGRSALDYAGSYFTKADEQALAQQGSWKIRYTDYDWTLNDTRVQ